MDRKQIILAGLATGNGASFSPVQVQKLFFLIDRNIPAIINGPLFNFQPYNYGPFDKAVYDTLEGLAAEGLVEIISQFTWKNYKLTDRGQETGENLLGELPEPARTYISELSSFVRSLPFSQLVSAIYKAYPEMRANSVFQG